MSASPRARFSRLRVLMMTISMPPASRETVVACMVRNRLIEVVAVIRTGASARVRAASARSPKRCAAASIALASAASSSPTAVGTSRFASRRKSWRPRSFSRALSLRVTVASLRASRAAATWSSVAMASAPPRATRANTGILKMPMATMALISPGPTSVVIRMATITEGKAKVRSEKRSTTHSTIPPQAAAASPMGTPIPMPIPTASTATMKLVSVPLITSDNRSRPKWSVPSQWVALGPAKRRAMAICSMGKGVHHSDTSPNRAKTSATKSPMTRLG